MGHRQDLGTKTQKELRSVLGWEGSPCTLTREGFTNHDSGNDGQQGIAEAEHALGVLRALHGFLILPARRQVSLFWLRRGHGRAWEKAQVRAWYESVSYFVLKHSVPARVCDQR